MIVFVSKYVNITNAGEMLQIVKKRCENSETSSCFCPGTG